MVYKVILVKLGGMVFFGLRLVSEILDNLNV